MSSEETPRITYDADWEPGKIGGIDATGLGLEVGQRVILVQPANVTEAPLEWPGIVDELHERSPGKQWAGVRMAGEDIAVSYDDLRTVLGYARQFDVDDDPAMIRVTAAAERYRKDWDL